MDDFAPILIGFIAGFIVCTKIALSIAIVVIESAQANAAGKPVWPVFTAMTLHSGPWLLLIVVVSLTLFLRASIQPTWGWNLLFGAAGGAIFYLAYLTMMLLRIKARRRNAPRPNPVPPPVL